MATVQESEFDWLALSQYISQRRRSLKMTQAQLANAIGRKQPDISAMERGSIRPNSIDTFIRLCDALEVSAATLIKKFRK